MTKTLDKRPTRDPMDLADCTCLNLRSATRVVTQGFDAALAPVGLKATQFSVLAALAGLGDVPVTRLAEALVLDRTTLTRNLKPLAAGGLVETVGDADQRVRRMQLTAKGRKLFETALPLWREAQAAMVDRLGRGRWAGLLDDLGAARGETRAAAKT